MNHSNLRIIPALLTLILAIFACNLPQPAEAPSADETSTPTFAALVSDTGTALPTDTASAVPLPTPQDPLVARAALCWWGPGPVYEVISSLKENARVKLVGRGSIPGWLLVENPIYQVPCWVQETYLKIEPRTDLSTLQIYTPPPTPTLSPVPTKTPTPTPTPP